MKPLQLFFIAIGVILFAVSSCQMDNEKQETNQHIDAPAISPDSARIEKKSRLTIPYVTQYNEETNRFEIIKNIEYEGSATTEDLVTALNTKYPDIKVEVLKKSNDTLTVHIPDASYLTQSIGTSGATSYLVEATYAFTTIEGIHVVDFSFEEGDHAVPGTYTREDFMDFFK